VDKRYDLLQPDDFELTAGMIATIAREEVCVCACMRTCAFTFGP
jgi:hypothetical protein